MEIRELISSEFDTALQLAWKVFQEYESPDYSEEGVQAFFNSIHDKDYLKMLRIYGAFENKNMVGILATRSSGSHVALFFVDGMHHRKGIGRQLFEKACSDNTSGTMTVNSSPYAVEVYHHLGFIDTGTEQVTNGIRYTPMVCSLKKYNVLRDV